MMAISINVNAQNVSSQNVEWQNFYLQWNPMSIVTERKTEDDQSMTGFSLGYNRSWSLAKDMPLFIESGLGIQYSFFHVDADPFNDNDDDSTDPAKQYKTYLGLFSAKLPVNIVYKWQASPSVAILPYAGLTARYNITGTQYNDDIDEDGFTTKKIKEMEKGKDPFDKKDMGSKDNTYNHFQLGWQIGIKGHFNNGLLLGLSYGKDFSEISKKRTVSITSITVGYNF